MGVHIKLLGTSFKNPKLETIPVFGFSDDFNRPNADTLGVTAEGKTWEAQPSNTQKGIRSGQAYIARAAAPFGPSYAAADAGTPNGSMEVKLTAGDVNMTGMVLRAASITNHLRYVASATAYRLEKVVDGATALVWTSTGVVPPTPTTLRAVLAGTTISLYADDALLTTLTVPDLAGNTRHGIYSSGEGAARIDYARFTA